MLKAKAACEDTIKPIFNNVNSPLQSTSSEL